MRCLDAVRASISIKAIWQTDERLDFVFLTAVDSINWGKTIYGYNLWENQSFFEKHWEILIYNKI